MSELTPQEKTLFEQAKQKEIDNWIQTNTITKVLENQIPPEQVMRSRWILTWKPLDDVNQDEISQRCSSKTHKPKARLVVLGYQDPKIDEIPRDSPTLGKTARMIILQAIASHGWQLMSFDIKAAFPSGSTTIRPHHGLRSSSRAAASHGYATP